MGRFDPTQQSLGSDGKKGPEVTKLMNYRSFSRRLWGSNSEQVKAGKTCVSEYVA